MGLEVRNIYKTFDMEQGPLHVLQDVSLEIPEGSIVSIVGNSGCGKSTLLKIIAGLETATSGSVVLNGKELAPTTHKEIGIIFQESRLFPWKTVEKNVAFGVPQGLSDAESRQLVQDHIHLVGLDGFEKALPSQLSGGMQQRVSIARSLVNRPQVLLLDEPFGALDAFTKITLQREVLRIWAEDRMTMMLVTHDIEEAIFMSDYIVVMDTHPGTIHEIIPVTLPRPHDRVSPEFTALKKRIYSHFWPEGDM